MELFFVQKESTDNAAANGKTSLEEDARKLKKKIHEIFHIGKIRAVDTVRV
jgi:hypothetical protein